LAKKNRELVELGLLVQIEFGSFGFTIREVPVYKATEIRFCNHRRNIFSLTGLTFGRCGWKSFPGRRRDQFLPKFDSLFYAF
jgi:hypothetical protein